jgi:hypothetical protein
MFKGSVFDLNILLLNHHRPTLIVQAEQAAEQAKGKNPPLIPFPSSPSPIYFLLS